MTPNEAAELMRRSQVGGVATSEFTAGGGYDAVKKLAESNTTGYQAGVRTVADMAKYAPDDKAVRVTAGTLPGGQNETFYASGNSATGGVPTAITSNDAYEVFQKARAAASKEASAVLDFSGPRGAATNQSVALSQAIVNKAGADALAKIGFMVNGNGEMVKLGSYTPPVTPTPVTPMPTPIPIVGKTTGSATVTPGAVSTPAATSTLQTAPTQLNAPIVGGGGGLITGANTLAYTPGTFSLGNTPTGNVNAGGLISGAQQQMFTQNAQVGLPTGVTPTIGAMGNNTGGASIAPYNPYNFTGTGTATGASQNWYNSKTGQRYTALPGYLPPSADWAKA